MMEDTDDSSHTVILVVANLEEEKTVVVDCLTKGGGWETYTTLAGVRILTHTSGDQVVDTLPLQNVPGKSPTAIARRWISQNSLRRIILGKRAIVVCVTTNTIVKVPCHTDVFSTENCWLDVLQLIWGNKEDTVTVAITESSDGVRPEWQKQLEHCLRRHQITSRSVLFSNFRTEASVGTLRRSIRDLCPNFCRRTEQTTFERGDSTSASFCRLPRRLGGNSLSEKVLGRDRYVAWSPERIILVGMTGSGKSTLAQMLTLGKLDQNCTTFKSSSSIRGGTHAVASGEGRGWYVVDTPGFGEPESEASTVPNRLAQQKVKNFVKMKEGTFSHFLFVLRKDRIVQFEVNLWKFFKKLFAALGESFSRHWSIVISNADDTWLLENISHLQKQFEGCSSFLTADFSSTDDDDEETKLDYENMRTESLTGLEEGLARLGRTDLTCDFGEKSRVSIMIDRDRGLNDEKVDRHFAIIADILEAFGYLGKNPFVSGFGLGAVSFFTSLDIYIHRLTGMMRKDTIIFDSADVG